MPSRAEIVNPCARHGAAEDGAGTATSTVEARATEVQAVVEVKVVAPVAEMQLSQPVHPLLGTPPVTPPCERIRSGRRATVIEPVPVTRNDVYIHEQEQPPPM